MLAVAPEFLQSAAQHSSPTAAAHIIRKPSLNQRLAGHIPLVGLYFDPGKRSEIVFVDGFNFGKEAGFAWLQSK